jgi:hypothetical protein
MLCGLSHPKSWIAQNTTQEVHMPRKAAAKSATKSAARSKKIPTVDEMVRDLKGSGLRVQLVGQIRNGQLQIDQSSLQELEKKFPNAKMTFVAVNAPFDPVRETSN